jgi:DNA-directed RNA polymerase specialized sigma24 family protein
MTMYRTRTDPALLFFGLGALACLVVSVPATAAAMELFHGVAWGIVATVVFEIGAVGSELSTLAIPQWRKRLLCLTVVLLLATTGANYALGVDAFVSATLPDSYASVRTAGYGWLLAVVASALFPALLFVFLTAFTARYRMLRGHYDTPMAAVAFWLSSAWQIVNTRMTEAEQRALLAEQSANDAEQRAVAIEQDREQIIVSGEKFARGVEQQIRQLEQRNKELEQRVNARPPQMEVEVIQVARYKLTLEQMANLLNTSVSTVRRRLPELAEKVSTE